MIHNSLRRGPAGKVIHLEELVLDDRNSNRWTRRGRKLLPRVIQFLGTGRSVLVDKNLRLIAGNKTFQSAVAAKVRTVVVIPSDGTQLIAVQRTDLDLLSDADARAMAIADNRMSDVSHAWDGAQLACNAADHEFDLPAVGFTRRELSRLHPSFAPPAKPVEIPESFQVVIECADEVEQERIFERMRAEGRKCRVLTL